MKKFLLIILDGWGYSSSIEGNAILQADTPNMDSFYKEYPWSLLDAAGKAVGLPNGQMGNSEVGHLNIGAGRIVCQELTRIEQCINNNDFFSNPVLLQAMNRAKAKKSALHLVGLVSDGGVHSHIDHLQALVEMAHQQGIEQVFIHAILDGRDTVPRGAEPYLKQLANNIKYPNSTIATVSGRYYTMDRDQRWERIERAYRAYARGEGIRASDPLEALRNAYERDESDEFVQPTVIANHDGKPLTVIGSEDSVIMFNFRPDRVRQICRTFLEQNFDCFDRGPNPPYPYLITLTEYDRNFQVPVAFAREDIQSTIGEVWSKTGTSQMRMAETEKYPHVTFFFNGGREKPFPGEERIMVPSPKVATYDLKPEMSAPELTEQIIGVIKNDQHPLIVANYANADMVGHTGKLKAAVKAVQAVDSALGFIAAEALPRDWHIMVCSDHGNAEQMLDSQGGKLTAHSSNPVPFLLLSSENYTLRPRGILADIAPTILQLAGMEIPRDMSGKSILSEKK